MAVDKNLFLYNLAVVAIMKNEGPYVKEWLDYHILAGVDHFFIYDNESPDNQREILQPYIERGIVTYIFYPGKARQYEAYNEAVQNFRFFCRYMAFIDGDEFILPKSRPSIPEVVDEVLSGKPNAAALGINSFTFGSNNLEQADYSRGVLERFTRRAETNWAPSTPNGSPGGNAHVKSIVDPRKVNFFPNPHFAFYFEGFSAINENGGVIPSFFNNPPTGEKIALHHYNVKSREEYLKKIGRGTADAMHNIYNMKVFNENDTNDVFDDSILKYRDARRASLTPFGRNIFEAVAPVNAQQISSALVQNLFPTLLRGTPVNFYGGKLENFLTCRAVAAFLKNNLFDETSGRFFEEAALNAVYKTLFTQISIADLRLLIAELPSILLLDYPAVKNIREACISLIPQFMNLFRVYDTNAWREFVQLKYLINLLKTFEPKK